MGVPADVVTLFDCDNTLLDNDRVVADLRNHLETDFGSQNRDRYLEIFEALRKELGYADYLGALQRYRLGANNDPRLLKMSSFLVDYPFVDRLYPGSLDVIEHFGRYGPTVILSDGDVVLSHTKSSAQDCGRRLTVVSLSIYIRSGCLMTSNNATQPGTMSWSMISCVSWLR
jgi:FMN phosphatase YigB (HAD superfamily)